MPSDAYHKLRKLVPKELRLAMLELRSRGEGNVIPKAKANDPAYIEELITRHGMVLGPLSLLFTVEIHDDGIHWHLSVAHQNRYPTWDELMVFRSVFFDDEMEVIQVLPPCDEYVNMHHNCFHLWHKTGKSIITLA